MNEMDREISAESKRRRSWRKWIAPLAMVFVLTATIGCESSGRGHDGDHLEDDHMGETNTIHDTEEHHHE